MIFNFPSQTEAMLRHDIAMLRESTCNQTTFYPLMASPVVNRELARTVGPVDYRRLLVAELVDDAFEGVSGAIRPDWSKAR
jgi:hypothetical protein